MRWLVGVALTILGAIPAAATPATEDVLREFHMFGTWAVECGKPPSPANPHVDVSNPGPGLVFEDHHLAGEGPVNRYTIIGAERLSDVRLSLDVIFEPGKPNEEHERLVLQVRGGTRRTLFNQVQDGQVRVKGGLVVGYGVKTPLLTKCD